MLNKYHIFTLLANSALLLFPIKRSAPESKCFSSVFQELYNNKVFGEYGTLIIATPTKEGLFIAADKRSYDKINGDTDTTVKIIQIGRFTAFTVTGNPTFLSVPNFKVLFSARNVVESLGVGDGNIDSESLRPFGDKLIKEFQNYILSNPSNLWPDKSDPPDATIFTVEFFQFNEVAKKYRISFIRFHYKKQLPYPEVSLNIYDVLPKAFLHSNIIPFGKTNVYNEVLSGKNKKFNFLCNNPVINFFIIDTLNQKLVSLNQAEDFSKYFIYQCSVLTPLIDQSPNHIGTTMDLAIIRPKTGFSWIGKNVISH
jgi:hypothetical protein